MQKLKSFTIYELLISLILSGIFAYLSYIVYVNIVKKIECDKNVSEYNSYIFEFRRTFNNDCRNSDKILAYDDGLLIEQPNGKLRYIIIEEGYVIRKTFEGNIDTFKISIKEFNYDFFSENILLISNMSFSFYRDKSIVTLDFFKEYKSEILVNYQINE
jgi:Tfp pilus assembly protein PilE